MSIIAPKRTGFIEKLIPTDAGATSVLLGTSGTPSGYTQMIASTSNPFVLLGAYTMFVFSESAASFSGAINYQLDIATGASLSEIIIAKIGGSTTIQYTHQAAASGQIGSANYNSIAPTLIPAGTRIAIRGVTPATHNLFTGTYLVGYEPTSGFPLPYEVPDPTEWYRAIRSGVTKIMPDNAFTSVTSHATTNWSYGTTVEFDSAADNDMFIKGVISGGVDSISVSTHGVIEIGLGSSGNEIWHSVVGLPGRLGMPGPGAGYYRLARPLFVPVGSRIAVRAKSQPANKTWEVALVYDQR